MGDNSCVVCGHREAADSYVCTLDHQRLSEQLSGLGGKVERLTSQLVPSGAVTGVGERVSVSRTSAPLPARLDVLTLLGPGTDRLSAKAMAGMYSPYVRRWRTTETVIVTGAGGSQHEREIVTWHQEIAAGALLTYSSSRDLDVTVRPGAMVPILHDDQVGLVPPRPWAHTWARRWQEALGQHQRPVRYAHGWEKNPAAAAHAFEDATARQEQAADLLGIRGPQPAAARPDDPLGHRWQQRFGRPEAGYGLTQDLNYLQRWLPAACTRDLDIAMFAAELRALSEELTRVLGDRPDQHWLGRCPAQLTDRDNGVSRVCGAGIWQDPYASQVSCLRCRSVWGPAKTDLIHLAVAIRKTWPVDRRRRYTAAELHTLPPLPCPGCPATVTVQWKEVTAYTEHVRTWQPVRAVCPAGCDTSRVI